MGYNPSELVQLSINPDIFHFLDLLTGSFRFYQDSKVDLGVKKYAKNKFQNLVENNILQPAYISIVWGRNAPLRNLYIVIKIILNDALKNRCKNSEKIDKK